MRYLFPCLCFIGLLWAPERVLMAQEYPLEQFSPKAPTTFWWEQDLADQYATDAVVIQRQGWVSFQAFARTPQIEYEYLTRIKILRPEGVRLALQSLRIPRNDPDGMLISLEATTYQLNPEGEVAAFPVNRRSIRESRQGDEMLYTWEQPFVREGSIIEVRYQLRSENVEQLRSWQFQTDLPVILSEVHTYIPYAYQYLILATGDVAPLKRYEEPFDFGRGVIRNTPGGSFNRPNPAFSNTNTFTQSQGSHEIFRMWNLPPIAEQEVFAPDNPAGYLPGLQWTLSKDLLRRVNNDNLYETWSQLDRDFQRNYRFRKLGRKDRLQLSQLARDLRGANPWQTISASYQEVRRRFDWNEAFSIQIDNANRAWRQQRGNSAEINLFLLWMLQEAGLPAYPVLISTREHGYVQQFYPLATQFNHLLVAVEQGGEYILLDAVNGLQKAGLLPRRDLNGNGFLINGDGGRWVPLQSYQRVNQVTYSRLTMSPEGKLSGEVSVVNQDYSAELEQKRLEQVNSDPEAYFREYVWARGSASEIQNAKSARPDQGEETLEFSCEVSTNEFVQQAGNLFFVRPMLMRQLGDNPFRAEKRTAPIDLTYPLREAHMLGLRIPDGYEIAQLPEPIRVVLPGNSGQFVYNVLAMNDQIVHISSTIQINRTRYAPEEYEAIRNFFEYVVRKHGEDIVLKKVE